MSELPRQVLRDLVLERREVEPKKRHDFLYRPAACRKLLHERCGDAFLTEINVLTAAVRDGVSAALEAWKPNVPIADFLEGLSAQLAEHHGMREEVARWAVEAWAEALGVLDPVETNPPTIFSTWKMEVLARSHNDAQAEWVRTGETPGVVTLPTDCLIGLRPEGVNSTNMQLWVDSVNAPDSMHYVNLSGAHLDDSALQHLQALKRLRVLNLASTDIMGKGLENLVRLPLRELNSADCRKLSNDGLACIGKLRELRSLDLSGDTAITVLGVRCLQQIPRLELIDLSGCISLDEEVLECLAAFPQLQYIDLSELPITGLGFLHFRKNQTLKELALEECAHLSDGGVAHLQLLGVLEHLWLAKTEITDTALDHISKIATLRRLYIQNCKNLTLERINAMPNHITVVDRQFVDTPRLSRRIIGGVA